MGKFVSITVSTWQAGIRVIGELTGSSLRVIVFRLLQFYFNQVRVFIKIKTFL